MLSECSRASRIHFNGHLGTDTVVLDSAVLQDVCVRSTGARVLNINAPNLHSLEVDDATLESMQLQSAVLQECRLSAAPRVHLDLIAPALRTLDVSGNMTVTDRDLSMFVACLPKLFMLVASRCPQLQAPSLTSSCLTSLLLDRCPSLHTVQLNCPQLQLLSLRYARVRWTDLISSLTYTSGATEVFMLQLEGCHITDQPNTDDMSQPGPASTDNDVTAAGFGGGTSAGSQRQLQYAKQQRPSKDQFENAGVQAFAPAYVNSSM